MFRDVRLRVVFGCGAEVGVVFCFSMKNINMPQKRELNHMERIGVLITHCLSWKNL